MHRIGLEQQLAFRILDACNQVGVDQKAAIGQGCITPCNLQRGGAGAAQ